MKFKIDDKVIVHEYPKDRKAIVTKAQKDPNSATGEWYLINFGREEGNKWTCGHNLELAPNIPKNRAKN